MLAVILSKELAQHEEAPVGLRGWAVCGRSQGGWQWGCWLVGAAAGPVSCKAELQGPVDLHGPQPDHGGVLCGAAADLKAVCGETEDTGYVPCLELRRTVRQDCYDLLSRC